MRKPTRVANGADWAITMGSEYVMRRITLKTGTCFLRMFSATRRIWFTKKTMKKKMKAMKKYRKSSFIR